MGSPLEDLKAFRALLVDERRRVILRRWRSPGALVMVDQTG
jgi:hypothetical protein